MYRFTKTVPTVSELIFIRRKAPESLWYCINLAGFKNKDPGFKINDVGTNLVDWDTS